MRWSCPLSADGVRFTFGIPPGKLNGSAAHMFIKTKAGTQVYIGKHAGILSGAFGTQREGALGKCG